MMEMIPDLNSHGLTNLLGALILAYILLDRAGMIRRPKFLGGKKNGNPGNPGNPSHLSHGEREAIYKTRAGVGDLVAIVCAKDSKQRPIIFQQAEDRHGEVIECLKEIKKVLEK